MADDYRALLDELAHNALYNQMNKLKHTRKDYEGHRDYLIRVVVDSTTISVSAGSTSSIPIPALDPPTRTGWSRRLVAWRRSP